MKQQFYLLAGFLLLTGCSSLKKTSSRAPALKVNENKNQGSINNGSILSEKHSIPSSRQKYKFQPVYASSEEPLISGRTGIESINALQFKYAILLNIPVETPLNTELIHFVDEWYGTPYRYGGTTKKGIDCSAFVSCFMSSVYGLEIPRNSKDQYTLSKKIKKRQLEQGDLVFFNTGTGVSHVGVYIANNKFVHASTSSGVIISDLDDDYFARRYVGSGRLR